MTVYYIGSDARITSEIFESRRPIHQAFQIAELTLVHTLRARGLFGSLSVHPVIGVCSTGLTGICGALAAADVFTDQMLPTLGVTGGAVLAAVVAGAWWSQRRRPLELRAIYRGQLVCIFQTNDRLVLGQVTRALLRVFEERRLRGREGHQSNASLHRHEQFASSADGIHR